MLDDIKSLAETLTILTQQGRTAESAIGEMYRDGKGVLLLSRALASFQQISTKEAQRLILKWTANITRPGQSPKGVRLLKPEVSDLFPKELELTNDEGGAPTNLDAPDGKPKGLMSSPVPSHD